MDWIEVAIPLAFLAVFLGIAHLMTWLFPVTGPVREGFRTVYPVKGRWKALSIGFGGLFLSVTSYLVFRHPEWAVVPAGLAAILLFALPGEIVLDERGISQAKLYLFPPWRRSISWDEVDSAYESMEMSGRYSSRKVATVSAGPDRTIKLSPYHAGVEEFLDQLQQRGIPIGRLAPRE